MFLLDPVIDMDMNNCTSSCVICQLSQLGPPRNHPIRPRPTSADCGNPVATQSNHKNLKVFCIQTPIKCPCHCIQNTLHQKYEWATASMQTTGTPTHKKHIDTSKYLYIYIHTKFICMYIYIYIHGCPTIHIYHTNINYPNNGKQ